MFKKLLCLLLALLVILPFISIGNTGAAANDTVSALVSLVDRFPDGKYWNSVGVNKNNSDSVTSTPCKSHSSCTWNKTCDCNNFDNAIQCMGYAHKIAYEITGVMPRNNFVKVTSLKASDLRVGDIIRYRWNGHSLCVTGVSGSKISFTDCNWVGRCQIRWGVMDISDIQGFSYVLRLPGNSRKNTDLYFYKNTVKTEPEVETETEADISKKDPHEDWKMVDATLNVRAEHSTEANVVGKIYPGTQFKVYDKYDDGEYLWGKILFDDVVGWCALNYAEYLGGKIEQPEFDNKVELYATGEEIALSWSEACGAGKYWLYIYDENGEIVQKYTVSKSKRARAITIDEAGCYSARVYAANSFVPGWKIASEDYFFTVMAQEEIIPVKSVKLSAPAKLAKGDSVIIDATVKPGDATDSSLTWKSSDTSVAVVNSNGRVTAKKYGTVKITCIAADRSEVKSSVTITVVPEKVSDLKQNYSTTGKLGLTWKKVSGATQYSIYRYDNESESYKKVAVTEDTSYTFKLTAGKSYKFKVHATAKVGSEYYSSEPSYITGIAGPKATELSARVTSGKVRLSWEKVSGATHYVVYRVSGDELIKVDTFESGTLSCTIAFSDDDTVCSYKVRTIRKDDGTTGYGTYSNTVKVSNQ